MLRLLKCEFKKFRNTYINSLSFLGMMFPLILVALMFAIKKNDWLKSGYYNWDNFNQQLSMFFIFLVGPIITSFIAVFTVYYEYQEKTIKNVLNSPHGRTSIIVSKIIYVSCFVILQYMVVAVVNIFCAFILGFDISTFKVWNYSLRLILAGVTTVSLVPIMTFATLIFRSFIPAMIITVSGTISNIFVLNSDKSYLSPWAIPSNISFIATSETNEVNIMYSIVFLCIYIVMFTACTIIYFNVSDQNV